MFNFFKRPATKLEKSVSQHTKDIDSVMRYQIVLNKRITVAEECVSQLTKDLNEEKRNNHIYSKRISNLEDDITVLVSHLEVIRDKLQANCVLTGDMSNKPVNCLRDRVAKLEGVQGRLSKDVDPKEFNQIKIPPAHITLDEELEPFFDFDKAVETAKLKYTPEVHQESEKVHHKCSVCPHAEDPYNPFCGLVDDNYIGATEVCLSRVIG